MLGPDMGSGCSGRAQTRSLRYAVHTEVSFQRPLPEGRWPGRPRAPLPPVHQPLLLVQGLQLWWGLRAPDSGERGGTAVTNRRQLVPLVIVLVPSLSRVQLFATPGTAARQASLASSPGNFIFSVLHHLLEFAQVHVHSAGDAILPPHPV